VLCLAVQDGPFGPRKEMKGNPFRREDERGVPALSTVPQAVGGGAPLPSGPTRVNLRIPAQRRRQTPQHSPQPVIPVP